MSTNSSSISSGATGWKKVKTVVTAVSISQGFKTLRDMTPESSLIESDRLHVQRILGEGAFAYVNLALLDGHRPVAMKSLKPTLLENPKDVKLFLKETELLRKIRHSAIVELIGVGGTTDAAGGLQDLYIVQEYCSGGSLRDLVFKQMTQPHRKLYSEADALRWSLSIAKALNYLHDAKPKIIHRDIKLDNILLTSKRRSKAVCKLGDFGLAKLVQSSEKAKQHREGVDKLVREPSILQKEIHRQRSERVLSKLDSSNVPFIDRKLLSIGNEAEMTSQAGSYTYMCPEVLKGTKYNEKADIFSFSMVMYNIFHRVIPSVLVLAHGGEVEDLYMLAVKTSMGYRPPLDENLPEKLKSLIKSCWNGVPELRPSAQEVVQRLEEILQSGVCSTLSDIADEGDDGDGNDVPSRMNKNVCCTVM